MKLEVNITKTRFFSILGLILILAGAIATYAYTTTFDRTVAQAPTFGHSADETVVKMADGSFKTVQELLAGGVSAGGGVSSVTGGTGISVSSVSGAVTVALKKDSTWSSYNWYYDQGLNSGLTPGTTSNPACDISGAGEYAFCPASYFVVGMHYCNAQNKVALLCAPSAPN
ncbi:MAG: hypothetical protein Q8Q31_02645 [Nanoarchaeota archaeon]|nr:hypothetical protein [Nanoarchaeota archaeon]